VCCCALTHTADHRLQNLNFARVVHCAPALCHIWRLPSMCWIGRAMTTRASRPAPRGQPRPPNHPAARPQRPTPPLAAPPTRGPNRPATPAATLPPAARPAQRLAATPPRTTAQTPTLVKRPVSKAAGVENEEKGKALRNERRGGFLSVYIFLPSSRVKILA